MKSFNGSRSRSIKNFRNSSRGGAEKVQKKILSADYYNAGESAGGEQKRSARFPSPGGGRGIIGNVVFWAGQQREGLLLDSQHQQTEEDPQKSPKKTNKKKTEFTKSGTSNQSFTEGGINALKRLSPSGVRGDYERGPRDGDGPATIPRERRLATQGKFRH